MNLRQAQRALADLMAKCQEAHVQLPIVESFDICIRSPLMHHMLGDPLDGLYEAGKALRHSRQNDKLEFEDALDELKQVFGVDPVWLQHEQEEQTKRANRQKRGRKPKSSYADTGTTAAPKGSRSMNVSSASSGGASGPEPGGAAAAAAMTKGKGAKDTTNEQQQQQQQQSTSQPKSKSSPRPPPPKSRIDTIKQQNPAKVPENQELTNEFVELGGYELTHGEKQKGISRMNVAKQIRNMSEPLKSGAQARQIPGVGPSAAAKVDEILHYGKMRTLEEYESSGGDDDDNKKENAQEL